MTRLTFAQSTTVTLEWYIGVSDPCFANRDSEITQTEDATSPMPIIFAGMFQRWVSGLLHDAILSITQGPEKIRMLAPQVAHCATGDVQ